MANSTTVSSTTEQRLDDVFVNDTVTGLLLRLRDTALQSRLLARRLKHRVIYDAPPPIYRLYRVDPDEITRSISWNRLENLGQAPKNEYFQYSRKPEIAGRVVGGDWDRATKPYEENVVYRSFVTRFVDGRPWAETQLYANVTARIERGEVWWGCSSIEEFEARCEYLDRLFEEIRENGYKTQRELSALGAGFEYRGCNPINAVVEGEVAVSIGRDGDLLFHDGRNRLSIAKILDLDELPVVVLVRHEKWQETRERVRNGANVPADLRDHPDIRQVLEGSS